MKTLASFALLLAVLSPVASAGVQPLERTDAGHAAVRVQLDGHAPQRFIVDTGASTTAVYGPARRSLALSPEPGAQAQLVGVGGAQAIERYRLPALTVAGVRVDGVLATGLPDGVAHGDGLAGILGRDVFGDRVVEFDFAAGRFGLHAPGTVPATRTGWTVLPIRLLPDAGFVLLDVQVDGRPVTAVLDTGARHSYVNWHAARQAGLAPGAAGLARGASSGGATAHRIEFDTAAFRKVEAGAVAFEAPRLRVADLPVFEPMGLADGPGLILGLDLLGDRRIVVDYPGRRLLVEARVAAPAAGNPAGPGAP
ncbi:retroviral-like aspartic protease family protein [Cognatilysobacter segetis]|uniref:retroviral-like aspartic protease family protein n=1 Tax=Cognatilysobacter segetis TaxID=2492394 RepID=UPI00106111FD|nr:retroviral-like aspartic protease family protein [Lysobacter segetis]